MVDFAYQCVLCGASLRQQGQASISCATCKSSYPIVGGVPVLVLNPTGLILAQRDQVGVDSGVRAGYDEFRSELEREGTSNQSLGAMDAGLDVWLANRE